MFRIKQKIGKETTSNMNDTITDSLDPTNFSNITTHMGEPTTVESTERIQSYPVSTEPVTDYVTDSVTDEPGLLFFVSVICVIIILNEILKFDWLTTAS